MDLENIKSLWDKEQISETPEISLEKQKEIRMPLEKIRKNMRMEFWASVVLLLPLVPLSPVILRFVGDIKFTTYFFAFLFSFLLIMIFYFFKFFSLYKDLESTDLSTKESLRDLTWKFKLNEQYYLSYYLACVPVYVFLFAITMDYLPIYNKITGSKFIYTFLIFLVATLFLMYYVGKMWFRKYYGRYIHQIKKTADSLN